ncbi:hypothetical protein [Thalassotalea fusca]
MLTFHIFAGALVLLSGIGALLSGKGSKIHRNTGNAFFITFILMAGSATYLADDPVIAIASIYFVSTAWVTIRRPEKKSGKFEIIAFFTITIVCARYFYVATTSPAGFMTTMYYLFGSIALLAAMLDLKLIIQKGISGAHRIARHLWRMCYALLGAVLSLVANTSGKWPEFIDENLPIFLVIVVMLYWLFRLLLTDWFAKRKSIIKKGA